jgi:hypothetical protein
MWKEIQGRNRASGPQSNSTSDLNSFSYTRHLHCDIYGSQISKEDL